jgi:hypothetical protein
MRKIPVLYIATSDLFNCTSPCDANFLLVRSYHDDKLVTKTQPNFLNKHKSYSYIAFELPQRSHRRHRNLTMYIEHKGIAGAVSNGKLSLLQKCPSCSQSHSPSVFSAMLAALSSVWRLRANVAQEAMRSSCIC